MSQIITISNITKVSNSNYQIDFSANFTLTDLFYEISPDGITWNSPIQINSVSSPQTVNIPNAIGFNLRLSSNYTAPSTRIHTNAFTNVFN